MTPKTVQFLTIIVLLLLDKNMENQGGKFSKFHRRSIPGDNNCLFNSVCYLKEGSYRNDLAFRLRTHCSEVVKSDPDMYCEAVLGMENAKYCTWITNPFNWGGETEINILSQHYKCEIAVVAMHGGFVMIYGEGNPGYVGRIYILYTGSHYDALVGITENGEFNTAEEVRIFPLSDETGKPMALEVARVAEEEAIRKASERRRKVLKCAGCGAMLDDNDAFQAHCMEVEHDDEFMFECEEVELVESIDDALPEGSIDLSSPEVY